MWKPNKPSNLENEHTTKTKLAKEGFGFLEPIGSLEILAVLMVLKGIKQVEKSMNTFMLTIVVLVQSSEK